MSHHSDPVVEDITTIAAAHREYSGHEKIFLIVDRESGLRAKIGIHSLVEGRALGGCRRWDYADESSWLADVLRLSRGMTRKAAVAGLPLGGAKAAICHPAPTPAMMRAFGRAMALIEERWGIVYITAEDMGITAAMLREVRTQTPHVRGIGPEGEGAAGLSGGDPGPFTACGVFAGMRVALRRRLEKDGFAGVRVAVQGLGGVGMRLCGLLHEAGAAIVAADPDENRLRDAVREYGVVAVPPDEIRTQDVDIFAPCAMGGILDETVRAAIVAGSANNQQKDEAGNAESKLLRARNILYAPDYVVNAGGLISVYYEGRGKDGVMEMIENQVGLTLNRIFTLADKENLDTATVADKLAGKMGAELKSSLEGRPGREAA